jgi:hypothetical protein
MDRGGFAFYFFYKKIKARTYTDRNSNDATTTRLKVSPSLIYSPAASFLRGARFFGFSSVAAAAVAGVAGLADVTLFNLALIAFLFLDTPYEPIETLPFLVFLSPLPMNF